MRQIKAFTQTTKELSFKLRILWAMISNDYHYWKEDVLNCDLDEPHCCGDVAKQLCGCGAITNREVLRWKHIDQYQHKEAEIISWRSK